MADRSNQPAMTADHPCITVIIPVRNEVGHIQRSLDAVLAQNYPADRLEIIVADGLSTDGTRALLDACQAGQENLKVINNPGQIVPTGLNAAIGAATGEIIVRIDGHTLIASDYVSECVAALRHTGADNVGGKMSAIGVGRFGEAVAVATSSPFGVGGARFHYSDRQEWVDTVYLGAWPRRVFEKIGLFDEELVRDQDDEFNYRLREAGGRILLSPKIKSIYTGRSTPRALWRQYFQYGFWKVRVLQKHPRQMRLRQFVPPTFVAGLLLLFLLALAVPGTGVGLVLLVVAYLAANLGASLWTASRQGWPHLWRLPLVYAILHGSYGLGFIVGLIKFANRWHDKTGRVPALGDTHA